MYARVCNVPFPLHFIANACRRPEHQILAREHVIAHLAARDGEASHEFKKCGMRIL